MSRNNDHGLQTTDHRTDAARANGTDATKGTNGGAKGWSIGDQMRAQRASQARFRLEAEVRNEARRLGASLRLADDLAERSRLAFEVVNGEARLLATDGKSAAMTEDGSRLVTAGEWVARELARAGVTAAKEAATLGPSPVELPRAQKNPWRKATWNLTEQMRILRRDPGLAERLRDEAEG